MRKPGFFIAVYALQRHYGGGEEGGWWYNTGVLIDTVATYTEKWAYARAAQLRCNDYAWTGDLYSVNYRSGAYRVEVHLSWPRETFSDWTPWE
jgi:hypothetical protein